MYAMNAADPPSTGAPLTSTFHQLSGGKSGSGPGRVPPCTGPRSAAPAGIVASSAATRKTTRRIQRMCIEPTGRAVRPIKRLLLG
jgi:hypothetical protein